MIMTKNEYLYISYNKYLYYWSNIAIGIVFIILSLHL
jgi:hypothetical protein